MTDPTPSPSLAALGLDDSVLERRAALGAGALPLGRVTSEHRGWWSVAHELGTDLCRAAGSLRHAAAELQELPAAGDWVLLDAIGNEGVPPVVVGVLPRTSCFRRKAAGRDARAQVVAANVDLALLVQSLNRDFNPRRLERYLALAWESGAEPVVVLTKADLAEDLAEAEAAVSAVAPGVRIVVCSVPDGVGIDDVRALLQPNRSAVLLGSSGAGKSTLANALLGEERFATGSIRDDDDRGRHTTTRRELVAVPGGGVLIDTPGMRELGLWDAAAGQAEVFDDIETIGQGCRFSDCAHGAEPGCAVRAAVEAGTLGADRLASWHRLRAEAEHMAARIDPRAAAARDAAFREQSRAIRAALKRKGR